MSAKSQEPRVQNAIAKLPPILQKHIQQQWEKLAAKKLPTTKDRDWIEGWIKTLACSDFAMQACLRRPDHIADLIESGDLHAKTNEDILARYRHPLENIQGEEELNRFLRRLRQRELLRIAWRDLSGLANLDETMLTTSNLADFCLQYALDWHFSQLSAKHGAPIGELSNEPAQMIILGMGKLGGQELNFSSDIDLIFAYTEDGETGAQETDAKQGLSNHEFFTRLGRKIINALDAATEDGFVFRVDMRLRPNGDSGALALSIDASEQYYQAHGRDWERYALIKARIVAGSQEGGTELLKRLTPFMYRKYLDYGALDAIRNMKAMIDREVIRKFIQTNIKLGPGGIREIEFIAQTFQLIRGGRDTSLRERRILRVLDCLSGKHLPPETAKTLHDAYCYLRRVENRLQMLADQQTHVLPKDELHCAQLYWGMNYTDWGTFEHDLSYHRQCAQKNFDELGLKAEKNALSETAAELEDVWLKHLKGPAGETILNKIGFKDHKDILRLLQQFRDSAFYLSLSGDGRQKLDRLMPLLLEKLPRDNGTETTLARLIQLLETIGKRTVYLTLLCEHQQALTQLVNFANASPWISRWLSQHPILLDELLRPEDIHALPNQTAMRSELIAKLEGHDKNDLETQMEMLREFCNGQILRVAAIDVKDHVAAEETGRRLASIADVVVESSLNLCLETLIEKHGKPKSVTKKQHSNELGFAIVAYGKYGSQEPGYNADLDLIFIYSDDYIEGATEGANSTSNETFFARLAQRFIHVLSTRTPGGILYKVDTRLRPSGNAGPLVTSLSNFAEYQRERAWTWEHQALVRARCVTGPKVLQEQFDSIRREILMRSRDATKLAEEVQQMRDKMRETIPPHKPEFFDLKRDSGGIIDIEFLVQYWVLHNAHKHPVLAKHNDTPGLLRALHKENCLERKWRERLIAAYHTYLTIDYRNQLMDEGPLALLEKLGHHPNEVKDIWSQAFK